MFSEIWTEFAAHWVPYTAVVLLAALIGYVTKVVAIELMFRPIDFRGVHLGKIPLGWQGIIPMRAAHMTSVATNKIIGDLITPADVWNQIDPARVLDEIREPLMDSMEAIVQEVAASTQPEVWGNLPGFVKGNIMGRLRERAPEAIEHIMRDIGDNVEEVLDLKALTTRTLVYDKTILQRVFRQAGKREWAFIRRFGLAAGFVIGLLQLVAYLILKSPLVNPVMGAVNGFVTDWFCIKGLLFHPKEPKKYLGIFTWQGLFLKYQDEVAEELADLVAAKVLTPHAVIDTLLRGPRSDRFFWVLQQHVGAMIDDELGLAQPLVKVSVGAANLDKVKTIMAERVMKSLPDIMIHAEGYIEDTLDIRHVLAERLKELPPEEFEGVLRPAFQQDEWTLISTGAILGTLAGFGQDIVIELFAK